MMCQCRFIRYDECTVLVGDMGSGGGYDVWGLVVYGKCLYLLLSCVVNLKQSLNFLKVRKIV